MSTRGSSGRTSWLVAMIVAACAASWAWRISSDAALFSVYPELRGASSQALPTTRAETSARVAADPRGAGLALLRRIVEKHAATHRAEFLWIDAGSDDLVRWEACCLADAAGGAVDDVLERIVRDPRADTDLRLDAVVALARPRQGPELDRFVDLVLDDELPPVLHDAMLDRLERLGGRPPERLHELLASPFGGFDVRAAIALASQGDFEAPSVLAAGLRHAALRGDVHRGPQCARHLAKFVTGDDALAARLQEAAKAFEWDSYPKVDHEERRQLRRQALDGVGRLADEVMAWIDMHPERADTEFERGRRAWRAGEQRRREEASRSIDDVIARGSEDFDLGAVLLAGSARAEEEEDGLAKLDRLARRVRRDAGAGADPTPEKWIEALRRRLLPARRFFNGRPSDLASVLETANGDCMGCSSLLLAIGERLGLPLYGVASPRHVFVRWDDGVVRRNIECTAEGEEYSNDWYATGGNGYRIAPEDAASGAYLRNWSKREFLASAIVNRAYDALRGGDVERAAADAERAIRLDPRSAIAHIARAKIHGHEDPARAVADVRAADALRHLSPGEITTAVDVLLRAGLADEALRICDRVASVDPDDPVVAAARCRALVRLQRLGEARRDLDPVLVRTPSKGEPLAADIELRIAASDASWRARLESVAKRPVSEPWIHLTVAERLLDGSADGAGRASDAAYVLDVVRGLETTTKAARYFPDSESRGAWAESFDDGDAVDSDRRRYYELRIRCCRALGDEAGAERYETARRGLDPKK